jgi:UDP-galactopyranose mutase
MMYDYLVVGAGLFGAVFARQMTDRGARCLVIDRRSHVGGNCYTREDGGIHVHEYGPHIFHTSSQQVWAYLQRWTAFNHYVHRPKVFCKGRVYSFPINLMTLHQLWGVTTPAEARAALAAARVPIETPANLEEWALSQVGEEIYHTFICGYTRKQWHRDPKDLPADIVKRLVFRFTFDDNYFNDRYQGIPIGGYTRLFLALLAGIPTEIGADFFADRSVFETQATKVVYTGSIDDLFDAEMGWLEWRSLTFEHESCSGDFQGVAIMNYPDEQVPFTRICEHKHFDFVDHDHTIITREYPRDWHPTEPRFYPLNDETNNALYRRYRSRVDGRRYLLGGRLADYRYYDMHQVVESALAAAAAE